MLLRSIGLSSIPSIRIVIWDVLLRTIRIEFPSLNYYSLGRWLLLWKAGYASSIGGGWNQCWSIHCHTKPIFNFDYHNKRSYTPNNMSSRKRRNTYWSINTFAPSVAKCIGRPICLCSSVAMCIDRSICYRWRAAICIDCTNTFEVQYD